MMTMGKILSLLIFVLLVACTPAIPEKPEEEAADEPAEEPETVEEPQTTYEPVDEPETVEEPQATEEPDVLEEAPEEPDRSPRLEATALPKPLERVPTVEPAQAVVGEVPDEIMNGIYADLAERTGADAADVEVVRAEQAIWNDGSLGCPQPGMMYTQALVDGYWVVLEYAGQSYDYRVNGRGYFALCESPPPGSNGAPTG